MPLICLSSPKGGVGKTTLTANLAFALQRLGHQTVVIDFDVQNALRLHFAIPLTEKRGFVSASLKQSDWLRMLLPTPSGIRVLPYGASTQAERVGFEERLRLDDNFLATGLKSLLEQPGLFVLADTPPGPSPALSALDKLADLRIIILLADAASVSLLPSIKRGEFLTVSNPNGVGFIINQVDRRRRLNREVTEFLEGHLEAVMLGSVHRDEALAEALAAQQPVFTFEPSSAAAYDIDLIARKLLKRFATHNQ